MRKTKVLLMITRDYQIEILNSSPRFLAYRFSSIGVIRFLEDSRTQIQEQKLTQALSRKIEQIRPKYLIVHLGMAFERYPIEFMTTILDINMLHPNLKIGLDRSLNYVIRQLRAIAGSEIADMDLLDRLDQKQSAFKPDAETTYLVGCLG